MLSKLIIKNYALIDDVEIDFQNGLTVITGETGAGKSILLGAVALLLGNRADRSMFKDQTKKCIIEGYFRIGSYNLKSFFDSNELDYEGESIIRREINIQGKSRSFINDTPVKLDLVKKLGDSLIDIHSQNQFSLINEPTFQFGFIDSTAGAEKLLNTFQEKNSSYKKALKSLNDLKEKISKDIQEKDYLQFQFDELNELKIKQGEEKELESEQRLLASSEELIQTMNQVNTILSENDQNVIEGINQTNNLLNKISDLNSSLGELSKRINIVAIEIEDIQSEVARFSDDFEFEPERLLLIDDRLNLIQKLKQKHQLTDSDDLISLQIELEAKLTTIDNFDDDLVKLVNQLNKTFSEMAEAADLLGEKRRGVISKIESKISQELKSLEIPNAVFQILLVKSESFNKYGNDSIEFLFSANKGIAPSVVSKTASGGEVSRLMLSLKSFMAEHKNLPTIIFDEIDTGVSGEVANKMGDILASLGGKRQVVSITHLPQIASKGNTHLFVYKEDYQEKTVSKIKRIDGQTRVEEIAKMLSGKTITEASINNALELINNN